MMMTVTADVPGRGHFESVPSVRGSVITGISFESTVTAWPVQCQCH
jgi:hypothetical protein